MLTEKDKETLNQKIQECLMNSKQRKDFKKVREFLNPKKLTFDELVDRLSLVFSYTTTLMLNCGWNEKDLIDGIKLTAGLNDAIEGNDDENAERTR